jgi:hypothetical protein
MPLVKSSSTSCQSSGTYSGHCDMPSPSGVQMALGGVHKAAHLVHLSRRSQLELYTSSWLPHRPPPTRTRWPYLQPPTRRPLTHGSARATKPVGAIRLYGLLPPPWSPGPQRGRSRTQPTHHGAPSTPNIDVICECIILLEFFDGRTCYATTVHAMHS